MLTFHYLSSRLEARLGACRLWDHNPSQPGHKLKQGLRLWTWRKAVYKLASRLTFSALCILPRSTFRGARVVASRLYNTSSSGLGLPTSSKIKTCPMLTHTPSGSLSQNQWALLPLPLVMVSSQRWKVTDPGRMQAFLHCLFFSPAMFFWLICKVYLWCMY